MPVKIRLQRHGKKGKPFYWIVAADARSKRDGRYLEKIGTYNPNVNPADIELDVDEAVKWLQNGAQPTDTAKAILSYKGAMLKNHLVGGIRKGALTEEQAEEKFQAWVEEKEAKITAKKESLAKTKADKKAEMLKTEAKISEDRAAAVVEAENAAIKAAADAKAAAEAPEEVEEEAPQTIDDAQAAASEEGKTVSVTEKTDSEEGKTDSEEEKTE
jgi:small subunit ribosomal protein S16